MENVAQAGGLAFDLAGGWPIHRFYFAIPTLGWPTRRGFRRVGTTDLYLLFPHLIRYWTMKRGKLNCACAGSCDKLSAKNLLRFVVPTRRKPRRVGQPLPW